MRPSPHELRRCRHPKRLRIKILRFKSFRKNILARPSPRSSIVTPYSSKIWTSNPPKKIDPDRLLPQPSCLPATALPIKISRNSDQYDGRAPEGFGGTRNDCVQGPDGADQHIDRGEPGISRAAVGTRNVRALPAQQKH